MRDTVAVVAYWVLKALLEPGVLCGLAGRGHRAEERAREMGQSSSPRITPLSATRSSCLSCSRGRVTFVAKAEYFDSWKTAWFFRAAGQIPMRREGGSASERALAAARDVLNQWRGARHLPRGHPLARRAALPRPHRSRAARTSVRCAGHPGRDHRDDRRPAGRLEHDATVQAREASSSALPGSVS